MILCHDVSRKKEYKNIYKDTAIPPFIALDSSGHSHFSSPLTQANPGTGFPPISWSRSVMICFHHF
jgi:hypothetical protein